MWRKLKELLIHQYWGIGIAKAEASTFLAPDARPTIDWISLPHFAADPMIVTYQGKTAILYEEFDYTSHQGRISAVCLEAGKVTQVIPSVIHTRFHASYPFCLEWEGALYCIPEQSASGQVNVYRATDFPAKWVEDRVLLSDVPLVDPTLLHHDGRWWLFGTQRGRKPNAVLWLYSSDSPWGPWVPHPKNPIKQDASSSRPAGPIFQANGRLIRPAQDCSRRYGGAVVLNEITRLTVDDYQEQTVSRIEPFRSSPYPWGIHHLCANQEYLVVDGLQHRFYVAQLRYELTRLFNKFTRRR